MHRPPRGRARLALLLALLMAGMVLGMAQHRPPGAPPRPVGVAAASHAGTTASVPEHAQTRAVLARVAQRLDHLLGVGCAWLERCRTHRPPRCPAPAGDAKGQERRAARGVRSDRWVGRQPLALQARRRCRCNARSAERRPSVSPRLCIEERQACDARWRFHHATMRWPTCAGCGAPGGRRRRRDSVARRRPATPPGIGVNDHGGGHESIY